MTAVMYCPHCARSISENYCFLAEMDAVGEEPAIDLYGFRCPHCDGAILAVALDTGKWPNRVAGKKQLLKHKVRSVPILVLHPDEPHRR